MPVQSEPQERVEATGWLDVRSAAAYLSMTEKAVRHAITSAGLPTHRTPTNRLLLKPSELDEWVVSREGAS